MICKVNDTRFSWRIKVSPHNMVIKFEKILLFVPFSDATFIINYSRPKLFHSFWWLIFKWLIIFRLTKLQAELWEPKIIGVFIDELMPHVASIDTFESNCIHKYHVWMASFLHGLIQHAFPSHIFENMCAHKLNNLMAFFLHELMLHVCSCDLFENSWSHKCHI